MAQATLGYAVLVPPDDPEALSGAVLSALDRPITPPPNLRLPSFDEVAVQHLRVFRAAHARRDHGVPGSAAA